MRTTIEIDDKLMRTAMKLARTKTKRETVEEALDLLVRLRKQERIRTLRGTVHWLGNLDEMRRD
jgi:Arc/MetJ family transcription regulator